MPCLFCLPSLSSNGDDEWNVLSLNLRASLRIQRKQTGKLAEVFWLRSRWIVSWDHFACRVMYSQPEDKHTVKWDLYVKRNIFKWFYLDFTKLITAFPLQNDSHLDFLICLCGAIPKRCTYLSFTLYTLRQKRTKKNYKTIVNHTD